MSQSKRVRLTQSGWEGKYTGTLCGDYEFVDGESVDAMTPREQRIIGAAIECVAISEEGEDEGQVGAAVSVQKAVDDDRKHMKSEQKRLEKEAEKLKKGQKIEQVKTKADNGIHTEVTLGEVIRSGGGLKALREIAKVIDPKIKGRDNATLVSKILEAQAKQLDAAKKGASKTVDQQEKDEKAAADEVAKASEAAAKAAAKAAKEKSVQVGDNDTAQDGGPNRHESNNPMGDEIVETPSGEPSPAVNAKPKG